MRCQTRRHWIGVGCLVIFGILTQAGCETTKASRSGVTSIEPVDSKLLSTQRPQAAQSVGMENAPSSGIVPAAYFQSSSESSVGSECSH